LLFLWASIVAFLGSTLCPLSLCLSLADLDFISNGLLAGGSSLQLVNAFHKDLLVLEHVTLRFHVQLVVHVSVNLLGVAILVEQTTKDASAAHPDNLERQTCVGGTLTLTVSGVTSEGFGVLAFEESSARVNDIRFLDDKPILNQLADVLTRVSHRDLVDFVGVHPDLPLSAFQNGRGEPLLQLKGNLREGDKEASQISM